MRNNFEGGFSLIELMVALVIGLLVVFGASSIFVAMKGSFNRLGAMSERQEAVRFLSDSILMDIRVSDGILLNYPEFVIGIPKRTHGSLYCSTDQDYDVYYRVSGGEVEVAKDCNNDGDVVDDGGYQPLISGVVDFSIQDVGVNRLYQVSLTLPPLDGVSGGGDVSYEFHAARRTPLVSP
ncbi:PilW family protein [Halomonas salifodinae]|uniref:PilW family protein n=1 Tax=Halomonas salifodinae TaxID=438745 RepID=A0ABW2F1A3_9GAMM